MSRATSVEPVNITPRTRAIGDQRGADASPSPGSSCSAPRGTPASCSSAHRVGGDQRRLLGRLGEHRVAGGQRGATWPVKIASGKFHGLMHTTGPSGRCVSVVEVARDLARRSSAGSRPPRAPRPMASGSGLAGLAHDQRHQRAACRASSRSAARSQARRRARPAASPASRRGCRAPASAGSIRRAWLRAPCRRCRAWSAGLSTRRAAPSRSPSARTAPPARSCPVLASAAAASAARRCSFAQVEARASCARGAVQCARQRDPDAARPAGSCARASRRPGRRPASSTGDRADRRCWLTKEVLAPFSSSRRTR